LIPTGILRRNSRMSSNQKKNIDNKEEELVIGGSSINDLLARKDGLGFDAYVKAVARFLTHKNTGTPLTLSIEGEWGSGKSTFMSLLESAINEKDQEYICINFNAWRHDKSDELWSAFALNFIQEVSSKIGFCRSAWAYTKLLLYRILPDKYSIYFYHILALLPYALLCFSIWLISKSFLQDSGFSWGVGLVGLLSAFPLYKTFEKVFQNFKSPVNIDFKQKAGGPNYEKRSPFILEFHADFEKIVKAFAGKKKVVIFIDDLDRCETPKSADLIEAINLMIAENEQLIFVLGIDREKIAASITAKHGSIAEFLHGEDKKEYGRKFMQKLIQIPFQVPIPTKEDYRKYLEELNNPQREEDKKIKAEKKQESALDEDSAEHESGLFQTVDEELEDVFNGEGTVEETEGSNTTVVTGREGKRVYEIVLMVSGALYNNPRRVKQFLNLFRLKAYIAHETGMFNWSDETEYERFTPEKLGKLIAIGMQWPQLIYDAIKMPSLFGKLEAEATSHTSLDEIFNEQYGNFNQKEKDTIQKWYAIPQLRELLSYGYNEAGGEGGFQQIYSLENLNLFKLFETSPRINTVKETTPESESKKDRKQEHLREQELQKEQEEDEKYQREQKDLREQEEKERKEDQERDEERYEQERHEWEQEQEREEERYKRDLEE